MSSNEIVRAAMRAQAEFCTSNQSPITGRICAALAEVLDPATLTGARALGWESDPIDDAVPLRLAGAFHALHRSGRAAMLGPVYRGEAEDARGAIRAAIAEQDAEIARWLDGPPQTNEVGRAGVFMAGLLAVAHRFPLPLELLELGSSAGLNLLMGHFAYDLGGVTAGDPAGTVRVVPEWRGSPPPAAKVEIHSARGVDIAPVDLTAPGAAERLIAFTWADQPERIARIIAAIALAGEHPPRLDQGDAVEWIEARLAEPQPEGVTRVLMHSIVFQYLSDEGVARIMRAMEEAGARATVERPLAWVAYESGGSLRQYELRLRLWPSGEERLLARLHPHGSWIEWVGGPEGVVTDSLPSWARPGAG